MSEPMEQEDCCIVSSKIDSLQDVIDELNKVFAEDRVNVEYVKALLSAYRSKPKDWRKFAKFDPHRYTRNLVSDGNGKYNLMALCWGEGHGSSIHDHADSHCFVKILDGSLRESMYEWPKNEQEMAKTEEKDFPKDGVAYINDSMGLHRMENPSNSDRAMSLHLYCPPFDSCKTFDERTGKERTCQVTFWSKFGERTPFGINECASVPNLETLAACSRQAENN